MAKILHGGRFQCKIVCVIWMRIANPPPMILSGIEHLIELLEIECSEGSNGQIIEEKWKKAGY
jgi:hypothetical protein